jgi:hypothetical protein
MEKELKKKVLTWESARREAANRQEWKTHVPSRAPHI